MKLRLGWLMITMSCIVSFGVGWFGQNYHKQQQTGLTQIRENSPKYAFINPLLLVDTPQPTPELYPLKKVLKQYIDSQKSKNEATSISVYFRDLNKGRWTGVYEDELYAPSSMLKVAVMMGYLKKAAKDPSIFSKKIFTTERVDFGQYYKPAHPLKSGNYSVETLIPAMIIESDNNALNSLFNNDRAALIDVFRELEIAPPPTIDTADFMSPKSYSKIFRTLFSATYLSDNSSEAALELLTHTNFNKGLVGGVPANTVVAHKFGEFSVLSETDEVKTRELHDCGIIYYPRHPYLLCVMTRGTNFPALEKIVSYISQITHKYVLEYANNPSYE